MRQWPQHNQYLVSLVGSAGVFDRNVAFRVLANACQRNISRVKQALAITGSVHQNGQVQAVGGVNQKIEGFFDLCHTHELVAGQGLVIPHATVKHLMLRQRVVDAVRKRSVSDLCGPQY